MTQLRPVQALTSRLPTAWFQQLILALRIRAVLAILLPKVRALQRLALAAFLER